MNARSVKLLLLGGMFYHFFIVTTVDYYLWA